MPHPEREHELQIALATALRERDEQKARADTAEAELAAVLETYSGEIKQDAATLEALAAARRALRDLLVACTSSPGASATADAVNHARAALAAPAAEDEKPGKVAETRAEIAERVRVDFERIYAEEAPSMDEPTRMLARRYVDAITAIARDAARAATQSGGKP